MKEGLSGITFTTEAGTNWLSCCATIVAVWRITPTQSLPNYTDLLTSPAGGPVTVGMLRRSVFDVIGNDDCRLFLKDQLFLKTDKEVLFPGPAGDTCTQYNRKPHVI